MDGISDQVDKGPRWPERPYKGFGAYGPDDVLLFSGRDDDIRRMSQVLAERNTRIVFLHGKTGCGKSSFLRAGLIPYIEGSISIEFLRAKSLSPLFIRSTNKPLIELATRLYEFCKLDYEVLTPEDEASLLPLPMLLEGLELASFVERFGNDPTLLIRLLGDIAALMPSTLAIIIDQAEEVLTVDSSAAGDIHRNKFFSFLAQLEPQRLDVKLLLAMRSEKFADFHTSVERLNRNFQFKTYGLQPLTERQMVEAILRPTSEVTSAGAPSPYDHYGFAFETDLARDIVRDVLQGSTPGGAMVVLQLLCDRLYTLTKTGQTHWTITRGQYESLGRVEVQVLYGVDAELRRMVYLSRDAEVTDVSVEVFRWKEALQTLISPQADGTVVTVLKQKEELLTAIEEQNCKLKADDVLARLCDDKVRVLKREYVVRVGDSKLIECYSLAHDAIALALRYWAEMFKSQRASMKQMARSLQWFAAVFAVVGSGGVVAQPDRTYLWLILLLCSVGAAIGAAILPSLASSSFVETYMRFAVRFLSIETVTRLVADGRYLSPDLYALYQNRLAAHQGKPSKPIEVEPQGFDTEQDVGGVEQVAAVAGDPLDSPEVAHPTPLDLPEPSRSTPSGIHPPALEGRGTVDTSAVANAGGVRPGTFSQPVFSAHYPSNAPRQLVLLFDGTNNNLSGRHADTHVVLLAELLRLFPDPRRLVYYDPGVGNPGQLPGTTVADTLSRAKERIEGLAFGRGVYDNIAEGYRFLMANWQPGDQIFLFGFSRGAFTARSVGGLVNAFGIIDSHQDTLVSSLVATYFSRPSPEQAAVRDQAARLFGQAGADQGRPAIHFVGVWDTVASVGLPPFDLKITARPTLGGKQFRHVRQALALDELRAQFAPRAYGQDDGAFQMADWGQGDIKQCWFRGSHCDVGGGNAYPYSELSRAPFAWMVAEAIQCGLGLPATSSRAAPFSEAEVLHLMPVLDPHPPQRHAARINSEIRSTPLWALTGLKVRDAAHSLVDGDHSMRVRMHAHPSVAQWMHAFPQRTAWSERYGMSAWVKLLLGLMLIVLLQLMMGWLHLSPTGVLPPLSQAQAALDANLSFQLWQLSQPLGNEWALVAKTFHRPGTALLLDLLLVATWAALLAPWVCRAFSRHAGLVQVGMSPSTWLNRAGWALPLAVGASLLEDVLTGFALWAVGFDTFLLWPLRFMLLAAGLAKFAGLLGVAMLILTSPFVSRSHRRRAPFST